MYGIVSDLVKGTYNMVSLRDNTHPLSAEGTQLSLLPYLMMMPPSNISVPISDSTSTTNAIFQSQTTKSTQEISITIASTQTRAPQ